MSEEGGGEGEREVERYREEGRRYRVGFETGTIFRIGKRLRKYVRSTVKHRIADR
jgi:hypothetical protein